MTKWISEGESQEKSIPRRAGEFALGFGTQLVKGGLEKAEFPSDISRLSEQHAAQHLAPITKRLSENSQQLLNNKTSTKQVSEYLEPAVKSYFGEKSIEPENFVSRGLQSVAKVAPELALGGFTAASLANPKTWINVLQGLPGALGSAIPGALAYELPGKETKDEGFGMKALRTSLSLATNILGKQGFKYIAQGLNKATNSNYFSEGGKSVVEQAKSDLYNKRDQLSSDIKRTGTRSIRNSLNNIIDESKGAEGIALSTADKAEIADKINTLQGIVPGILENPSKFIKVKEAINKLFEKWQTPALRPWFAKMRSAIESELDTIGKNHPEWNTARKTADELHTLQKWQPNLVRYIIEWTGTGKIYDLVSNPIAQGALASMAGLSKGSPYYAAVAASPIAGKLAIETQRGFKFFNYLRKTIEGQKLLMNIGLNAAKGSEVALVKDLRAMNRLVPKFEKQEKQNKSKTKKWIIG